MPKPDAHIHLPDGSCCAPKKFAHLHQHTQYSLLDGAAKLKDLLKWVKEVTPNDPACAITDHGNMHGAVHFYNYARALGVKPILGFEAYFTPGSRHDRKRGDDGEKSTYHLTLLAQNFEGYRNLCKLSSEGFLNGYYGKPRIDSEILAQHSAGVIALSGCIGAEINQLILRDRLEDARARMEWFARTFPGRYFVEVQRHGNPDSANEDERELAGLQLRTNPVLREWANELGLPIVVTNDGHYVKREDAEAHDALLAIQTKSTLDDPKRFKFACDDFYVKPPAELQKLLPVSEWGEEVYDNTALVASMCEDDYLPVGKKRTYQLPVLPLPEGMTMAEELRVQTYDGLVRRYPAVTREVLGAYARATEQALGEHAREVLKRVGASRIERDEDVTRFLAFAGTHWEEQSKQAEQRFTAYPALATLEGEARVLIERAEYELGVINRMGFADYFLIVADYINWAKDHGIAVGGGRGSGAGSIVAYCTRITNLDPIRYKLLFERFLNPDRISMPDFDIDFDDRRRGDVVNYVRAKYGDLRVAQIATHGSMNAKTALKDVAKVMGLPFADTNKLTKLIPVVFGKSVSLKDARANVEEIEEVLKANEPLRKAYDFAMNMEGLAKSVGVHAAGIVIGRTDLTDLVPLMRDAGGEGMVCQYDMKAVEDIGLVKMDFLGLRTLSFLQECVRLVKDSRDTDLDLDAIDLEDEDTYAMLSRGDTKGVFQLEGGGITAAARSLKPRRLEDIIALSALYRPGPMENIPTYVKRHHGEEDVSYEGFEKSADKLRLILADTYGIPVYQEQIMQIASEVAGYSLGEADLLRRAMGKKDGEEMQRQKALFVQGAANTNRVPEDEALRLFALLEKFANYGFNRSHAAAYGVITYQTAYIKAKYPVEFAAALLTVEQGDSDKVAEYVQDARRSGIEVLAPDINKSQHDFRVSGRTILFGLGAVKQISADTVVAFLDERVRGGPFRSLADFCKRMPGKFRNKRVVENLVKAGAFDAFSERGALLEHIPDAVDYAEASARMNAGNMESLFGMAETLPEPGVPRRAPQEEIERLRSEKEVLGLYLTGHPLAQYPGLAETAYTCIKDLEGYFQSAERDVRGRVKCLLVGVVENVQKKATKTGGMMARFNLSDETGTAELVCFPKAYEKVADKLQDDHIALLAVEMDEEEGSLRVILDNCLTPDEIKDVRKVVTLELNVENASREELLDLHERIETGDGRTPILVKLVLGDYYELREPDGMCVDVGELDELTRDYPWLQARVSYDRAAVLSLASPPRAQPWRSKPQGPPLSA